MIATSDYRELLEERLKDPAFKKELEKIQPKMESNSKFYKDTMTGLVEALIIEKSDSVKVKQHTEENKCQMTFDKYIQTKVSPEMRAEVEREAEKINKKIKKRNRKKK